MREKYIKVLKVSLIYSIAIEAIFLLLDIINKNFFVKESILQFITIFIILFLLKTCTIKIKNEKL